MGGKDERRITNQNNRNSCNCCDNTCCPSNRFNDGVEMMKLGDFIKAESNGGWTRFYGIFLKDYEKEIALEIDGEVRYFKKELFNFTETDVNGREIK